MQTATADASLPAFLFIAMNGRFVEMWNAFIEFDQIREICEMISKLERNG